MSDTYTLPTVITEKEAAERLGISTSTLRRIRYLGRITYRKVGRSIKYTEADLIEHLDNGRVPCKTNNTSDKSESIGCHIEMDRVPGVVPGSTSVHDKQRAHRLAQMTFSKPS